MSAKRPSENPSRGPGRRTLAAASLLLAAALPAQEPVRPDRDGLAVGAATRFAPGRYLVPDVAKDGVIHVKGKGIVLDFTGVELVGSPDDAPPDRFEGFGVVIEDSEEVTIRNLRVRGYRVGIKAKGCRGLVIEGCDVSDSHKQRLLSTPEAENPSDWLRPHDNDQGEWLRYGAGIYLEDCADFTVRGCTGKRGQNGLCLTRCTEGKVFDNDMSFNSGWGLALYRSSGNEVSHNRFDWCIRGYSHGVYNRGQDSAGILVFEQCSDNVFAYNSATHGGDGFFLYAGQDTLERTGRGGSNNNLLYRNDFSHASNNGIEATFSRGNRFHENVIDQADHAIWAGYSYETEIIGNEIRRCNHGISIEHGSNTWIEGNRFEDNGVAVNLWAGDDSPFAKMIYGKEHHCRSERYTIVRNRFRGNRTAFRFRNTGQVSIAFNTVEGSETALEVAGRAPMVRVIENNIEGERRVESGIELAMGQNWWTKCSTPWPIPSAGPHQIDFEQISKRIEPPAVRGTLDAMLPKDAARGLEMMIVDEWGPYDFARPKAVPADGVAWQEARVRLLWKKGPFTVEAVEGDVEVAPRTGAVPATLAVTPKRAGHVPFALKVRLEGVAAPLEARGVILGVTWDVRFYRWEPAGAGKPPADWKKVLAGKPILERRLPRLDFVFGGGGPAEGLPADHFATVATATIDLPAGRYEIRTVSDDGVRVFIDDEAVIDNWTWHPPTADTASVTLKKGPHRFRVEHFEIDGFAQLQLWIR